MNAENASGSASHWKSWRGILERFPGRFDLKPAPQPDRLREVTDALGCEIPHELSAFYAEAGNLLDKQGEVFLLWSIGELIRTNRRLRESEREDGATPVLSNLLLFGEDGCGNYYGYRLNHTIREDPICFWDHEVNEVSDFAEDLGCYLWYRVTGER
ncbi:MAG: SMI1/KNR4 family protein [Planctomycetia bacterium]|nr:SMI1/KNR4 family protein [Planctomycetia bacterium]